MAKRHPIPPETLGTRCVPIVIPDSPEYAQLLIFAVRKMCQQSYYERDSTGTLAKQVADNLKIITLEPLINNLLAGMDCGDVMPIDCGELEPCIEDSPTVTNIITNQNSFNQLYQEIYINQDTILDRRTLEQLETGYQELPPPSPGDTCNYDALWAGCLSVVNYLDTITRDYLEKLTASFDQNVRYASNIEAIPFLAELPVDEVIEYTTYITQELENSYNATVTLEFLQTVACDLFCGLKDNCASLNPKYLLEYLYSTQLNIDWTIVAQYGLAQQVGIPIELFLAGADMVYFQWGFAVWLMSTQANFYGGRGEKNISVAYRLGLNSPDGDWAILCDCPVVPICGTIETSIATGAVSLPPPSPLAVGSAVTINNPAPAIGLSYNLNTVASTGYIEFNEAHCFSAVEFRYRVSGSGAGNITHVRFEVDGTVIEDIALSPNTVGGVFTKKFVLTNTVQGDSIRWYPFPATSTRSLNVNAITVYVKDT